MKSMSSKKRKRGVPNDIVAVVGPDSGGNDERGHEDSGNDDEEEFVNASFCNEGSTGRAGLLTTHAPYATRSSFLEEIRKAVSKVNDTTTNYRLLMDDAAVAEKKKKDETEDKDDISDVYGGKGTQ